MFLSDRLAMNLSATVLLYAVPRAAALIRPNSWRILRCRVAAFERRESPSHNSRQTVSAN